VSQAIVWFLKYLDIVTRVPIIAESNYYPRNICTSVTVSVIPH